MTHLLPLSHLHLMENAVIKSLVQQQASQYGYVRIRCVCVLLAEPATSPSGLAPLSEA